MVRSREDPLLGLQTATVYLGAHMASFVLRRETGRSKLSGVSSKRALVPP